jgi:hypothetical protein
LFPVECPPFPSFPFCAEGQHGLRDPSRCDRQCGISRVAYQPLEFDADPSRRPRLQADSVNMPCRALLIESTIIEAASIDDRHVATVTRGSDIPGSGEPRMLV